MKFCPECGVAYDCGPDEEGIHDCGNCGLWTLPVFWEVRNDLDYTTI